MLFLYSGAQTPAGISYQAVLRGTDGQILVSKDVWLRMALVSGVTEYYTEVHAVRTSAQGIVTLTIGAGSEQTGSFAAIPWATAAIGLKVGLRLSATGSFTDMGVQPMTAVPYALYSASGTPGRDGISLQWMGSAAGHPTSPALNQAYYNTTEGKAYIYDGDSWEMLVQDGQNGMIVPGSVGQTMVYTGAGWTATSKIAITADTVKIGTLTPVSKLVVQGRATSLPEDPIFEVRNKDGKVVLGVYNEGVRVYVDDSGSKGAKGGFAVGGLSTQGKASNVEYLRITPDSARIYIDTSSAKGAKGGFAVGGLSTQGKAVPYELLRVTKDSTRIYVAESNAKGAKGGFAVGGLSTQGKASKYDMLRVTKDSTRVYINDIGKGAKGGFAVGGLSTQGKGLSTNYFDIETDASGTIANSKNKVLWYPLKNAFLAGRVLIESPDSVGVNSFATGFESKAVGAFSQAMGYQSNSGGDYSTAIGKKALSKGLNSFAFGDSAIASGSNSYAFGNKSLASGDQSFAFGSWTRESIFSSILGTEALGVNSIAIGVGAKARADNAISIGSAGTYTIPPYPMPVFATNNANASSTLVLGFANTADSTYSILLGRANKSFAFNGMAFGYQNTVNGKYSYAIGHGNKTIGEQSTAIGYYTVSKDNQSTVVGAYNDTTLNNVRFAVGNGKQVFTSITRKNAFTVFKDGSVSVTGAVSMPINTVAANTILDASYYTVLANAAPITITLPAASTCSGRIYVIKKITATAGNITIEASGAETIDGTLNRTLTTQWSKYILQSNGTEWYIIN